MTLPTIPSGVITAIPRITPPIDPRSMNTTRELAEVLSPITRAGKVFDGFLAWNAPSATARSALRNSDFRYWFSSFSLPRSLPSCLFSSARLCRLTYLPTESTVPPRTVSITLAIGVTAVTAHTRIRRMSWLLFTW